MLRKAREQSRRKGAWERGFARFSFVDVIRGEGREFLESADPRMPDRGR